MVPSPTIRAGRIFRGATFVFLAAALGSPLAGEEAWEAKPAERWSAEEALEVLQDSPWAQEKEVAMPWPRPRYENPQLPSPRSRRSAPPLAGSRRAPESPFLDSARYLVRWESARPVREAFVRLAGLGEEASAHFQSPPPSWPEEVYIVTVKTVRPPRSGHEPLERLENAALMAARLKTEQAEVKAVEVERSGLGANAAVHFFFPRTAGGTPLLASKEEEVEFHLEVGGFNLKSKFLLEPKWLQ